MKKYTSPELKDTKYEATDIIAVSPVDTEFDPLDGAGAHYAGSTSYNWTPMEKK